MIALREQQKMDGGVSREQLEKVELVRPDNAGAYWQGVPHHRLVDTIASEVEHRGIEIKNEEWHLFGNNARLVGKMDLVVPNAILPEGMTFSLGILHGNDLSHALRFAVGACVFVCSNGIVTGDFIVKKRHTLNFDLDDVVCEGIDRYMEEVNQLDGFVRHLKETPMLAAETDRVLMEAGRQKLLPWSRIGNVDREFREPIFSDFGKHRKDAWGLYNAFTYTIQKSRPQKQIKSMVLFRDILMPVEAVANN